ncbi:pantoate--beta-alanine ligase [Alteromonas halophila]|uniref:Pantothenate synthetase n=1 Tax=Alteromonas halophila TaxID=516698 RepID=A0A918MYE0_9ALTE|nr:pantoate--beta-alanine ligase [Alteromonas halophila]GGW83056.1 pantothenate synthetase [Alteromonas halophila]
MQVIESIDALRAQTKAWREQGKTIGFVPTMGNLHHGHLTLIDEARRHCDVVIASIFVNPMQFGENEDLATYPRTLPEDKQHLTDHGADALFLPSVKAMYPRGLAQQTIVEVPGLSDVVCGASRPGHFRGVATVVCKLFNMVAPDHAFFGKKDYQQLKVIKMMAMDLSMDIQIHGVPTQRADSGLALSSRNGYLSENEMQVAPTLYAVMCALKADIEAGERDYPALIASHTNTLRDAGFRPDYIEVLNADTLTAPAANDTSLVILIAAFLGTTRLIDNIEVSV